MAKPDYRSAGWSHKFLHAIRGLRVGSRGDSSFFVHIPTACFVLAAAAQLHVSAIEWCVLILCIMVVLAAELLNCALERMARVVTQQHNEEVRDALDIAAAGVLVAALGSVVVGAIILGFRLIAYLGWWQLPTGA
jgi:diacylglycerol kinase